MRAHCTLPYQTCQPNFSQPNLGQPNYSQPNLSQPNVGQPITTRKLRGYVVFNVYFVMKYQSAVKRKRLKYLL